MTLFLCVFLIPFVAIGVGSFGAALLTLFGQIRATICEADAQVTSGIGPFVWRRKFDPRTVHRVYEQVRFSGHDGPRGSLIVIDANRTIKMGTNLEDHRLDWLFIVLREILTTKDAMRRQKVISRILAAAENQQA